LVDLSAPNIVGTYLLDKKEERKVLYKFVKSKKSLGKKNFNFGNVYIPAK